MQSSLSATDQPPTDTVEFKYVKDLYDECACKYIPKLEMPPWITATIIMHVIFTDNLPLLWYNSNVYFWYEIYRLLEHKLFSINSLRPSDAYMRQ